jgi:hypothetical protein
MTDKTPEPAPNQMPPLGFERISVPKTFDIRTRGSQVKVAAERLAGVPEAIRRGIPESVWAATEIPAEGGVKLYTVWRPAVAHVEGWNLFGAVAEAFPTIEAVYATGRLPQGDYRLLTQARDRFLAAGGKYTEAIPKGEVFEVRRAFNNVNRAIDGKRPYSRDTVLQRISENAEARKARQSNRKPNAESDATILLRKLVTSWNSWADDKTPENRRVLVEALRSFGKSPGYDIFMAHLDDTTDQQAFEMLTELIVSWNEWMADPNPMTKRRVSDAIRTFKRSPAFDILRAQLDRGTPR